MSFGAKDADIVGNIKLLQSYQVVCIGNRLPIQVWRAKVVTLDKCIVMPLEVISVQIHYIIKLGQYNNLFNLIAIIPVYILTSTANIQLLKLAEIFPRSPL